MSSLNLKNKSILITRPKMQTERLASELAAKGGVVVMAPMINIEPTTNFDLRSVILILQQSAAVIFVSVNAVKYGLRNSLELIDSLKGKDIFAVGKSTALTLVDRGLENVVFPKDDHTSEGLLDLEQLRSAAVLAKTVTIFKGIGGRPILGSILQDRGALVRTVECYTRTHTCFSLRDLLGLHDLKMPSVIVATSVSILVNLVRKIENENLNCLYEVPMIVASRRLERFAKSTGFRGDIILAKSADNKAIVEAISVWMDG